MITLQIVMINYKYANNLFCLSVRKVVASQDWPEVTKYAGLVCAQAHRQELIQDLYKTWHDPQRGTVTGGMIRFCSTSFAMSSSFVHCVCSWFGYQLSC